QKSLCFQQGKRTQHNAFREAVVQPPRSLINFLSIQAAAEPQTLISETVKAYVATLFLLFCQ
ncbi:MAG: hypothetical protein ACK5FV_02815, partial [Bacteroidota bacterium]